ncbi:serine hydrolase domain-containing protein [Caulobacter sp. KR2-114]|uniref:serine hydrolase domain-containing protein n=1 Tax=Caulobacter sp. KR2-114 TaxID=3400912 RepID=UPI003BFC559F
MSSGQSNPVVTHGFCAPPFEQVAAEFALNFAERGEVGAAVAIFHEGRLVVDLWAGVADAATHRPWEEDTLAVMFSATKGLAATCLHILADRGLIAFDRPMADYWPQFAANGKAGVTVAMILSHQAGLPVWQAPLPEGALYDWDLAASRLAAEAPLWEPGTAHGYHGVTIGWLEGELVRRVTGKSIGQFFREDVAGPLGADAWIGLPEAEHHRAADLILPQADPGSAFFRKIADEPDWYGAKMMSNSGGDIGPDTVNSARRRSMEHPSAGGAASARGLARVYAPLSLDGSVDGVRLVREEALVGMRLCRSASDCDLLLRLPTTFTLGFSKTWGDRRLGAGNHVILGEQAFGTPGMGGSLGFADGEARLSFGYVMNRLGGGVGLNDRGQSLVDAAYRAVGFRPSPAGPWTR